MPDLVAQLEQQIATWREEARAIEAVGHDGSYVAECADELSALCRAWQEEQGKERAMDEFGYLIEQQLYSVAHYWTGRALAGDAMAWSTKPDEGCRFAREQDAAIVLAWLLHGIGRTAQHGWMTREEQSYKVSPASSEFTRHEWQPIETAPKDGTLVIVHTNAVQDLPAFQTVCRWHPDAGWCVDELRAVTHWMPLPAAPTPTEESR